MGVGCGQRGCAGIRRSAQDLWYIRRPCRKTASAFGMGAMDTGCGRRPALGILMLGSAESALRNVPAATQRGRAAHSRDSTAAV